MYAGKQAFLGVGILIISILILSFLKYSKVEGFTAVGGTWVNSCNNRSTSNYTASGNCLKADGYTRISSSVSSCLSAENRNGIITCTSAYTPPLCTTGTYNISTGRSPCTSCPENSTCSGSTITCNSGFTKSGITCQQLTCPAGQYRSGSSCLSCGAGTTSSSGATSCTNCGPGTYASGTGQAPCTACPANATCTTTNFTCNPGFTKSGSVCQQITCPAGQYLSGSTCTFCPSSTYQPQSNFTGNSCKAIPPSNVASSTPSSVTCATGYTLSADGTQCQASSCTAGTNYNSVTGKTPCTTCPLNSSCTATGYTCQSGYTASGLTCEPGPCAQGTYSTSGKIPCTPCQTGYTTTETGQTSSTSCQTTIQVTDILNKLNYSATNIPGQFFGLMPANINVTGPQTIRQGQAINYLSYVTPASLVTAAAINYINGTTYNLTNPQGKPVNRQGSVPIIMSTLPPGTKGSIENMNTNSLICTGVTPASCTFVYNVPGGGTQSTNPCPSMNSIYDFDKGFCVDNNGNRVSTTRSCDSSSLFNSQVNACIPVRAPYFKTQPPNTTGNPVAGDYANCLSINGADCQPVYTIGTTKTATNPCSGSTPIYDFTSRSCKPSVRQTQGSSCCSMGITAASAIAACTPYITTTTTKNATLCASKPSICCQSPSYSTISSCKNQKYWTDNKSYKSGVCSTTGFIDIGDDTMQNKVRQWAEKRKMLNIP